MEKKKGQWQEDLTPIIKKIQELEKEFPLNLINRAVTKLWNIEKKKKEVKEAIEDWKKAGKELENKHKELLRSGK